MSSSGTNFIIKILQIVNNKIETVEGVEWSASNFFKHALFKQTRKQVRHCDKKSSEDALCTNKNHCKEFKNQFLVRFSKL